MQKRIFVWRGGRRRRPQSRVTKHMAHFIQFVQQYSATLVDPYGRRYVARVYGACRPDDLWDGWFVFFPLDGGRAVATDRETTQGSLAAVRYWASGISTLYLYGALERARAMLPEAQLARRQAQAKEEEARARAEAADYEAAAHAARKAALDTDRRRRETEAMLLAEREATARAAARLHDQAARSARYDASEAHRRMREFMRKHSSERRYTSQPSARPVAADAPRRRRSAHAKATPRTHTKPRGDKK